MKQSKIIKIFANFLPYLTVFFASLFHPYDSDMGWHLKYGEYFFKNHQILRDNIFSTEMADYRWVNSSWLTDLISYATFENFGFLGFSTLGALTITATFYLFSKAAKLDIFEKALIFPLLLWLIAPLNSVSFRGQLLSLLLLGFLIYLLNKFQTRFGTGRQTGFGEWIWLPALFAVWSNLHGQFILGLAVFAIWIGATIGSEVFIGERPGQINLKFEIARFERVSSRKGNWKLNRTNLKLIAIFTASALATLINPFGIGVYQEAIKHFGNPLEAYISEWVPFKMLTIPWWGQVLAGLTVFFGIIFLAFTDKIKSNVPQISIAAIVYFLSFSVRRFVWPMYYLVIPLLAPVAGFFKPESKKYTQIAGVTIFAIYLIVTFVFANPVKRIQNMSWQSYCTKYTHCSDTAFQYLTSNKLTTNLLTYYGWGGYLIWRYPDVKPSIDGRMHLWRDEAGYSAFEDYYAYEQNNREIDNSGYNIVLMSPDKPLYTHLKKLTAAGKWQLAYEDKYAGVFVRKKVL